MGKARRIGREQRALPHSLADWRARFRDAMAFEDRMQQPLPAGKELIHRVGVLTLVSVLTGIMVALAFSPAIAIFGKTVGHVTSRFSSPLADVALPQIAQRSVVLDRNGTVLATLAGEENRVSVPLTRVPALTQEAVLAIEDAKFYQHHGVDLAGLVRALLSNVRSGGIRQGGSTITQQLVKNTIVGTERTLDRKIREARTAVALEKNMSKHQILEAYLNETYFGNGVYGIGTAAEFYFGEPVEKLTLAQSALLAGIIKAPENYEPIGNPGAARGRRDLVLNRMVDVGSIKGAEADAAQKLPLGAKAHPLPKARTPYFVEYIKQQILSDERFGKDRAARARALFQAGLQIKTTLDLKLEDAAQHSVDSVLNKPSDPSAALVSIDAKTGAVRAIISGRDFETQHYDLAVQGRRQPGSTFKPFTLLAALDAGISPSLTFDTPSPLIIKQPGGATISVNNYDGVGRGFINMRTATEESVNTYYMQLIQRVGPENVVAMATRMGIGTELQPFLSLALGTIEVSPYELTSAYSTLANGGVHCTPYTIVSVTDADGNVLLNNKPDCQEAIPPGLAAQATSILRGVVERGTGHKNGRLPGRATAGKTGTTDNYTDAWYAGYTPQFATVVWLGFPESNRRPLKNIHGLPKVFGGSLPAMIWNRYMREAHRGLPVEGFPSPPAFAGTTVPDVTGTLIDDAKKVLDEAGFPTTKIVNVGSALPKGTVVAQNPVGGTSAGGGVVVTLEVSTGIGPPPKPSPSPSPSPSPTKTKK